MHKYILLSIVLTIMLFLWAGGHRKQVIKDFLDMLKTGSGGYSNTKVIAWVVIIVALYIITKHTDATNVKDILAYLLAFVAIALGLVKVGDLIQLRTGQKVTETEMQIGAKSEKTKIQEPAQPESDQK